MMQRVLSPLIGIIILLGLAAGGLVLAQPAPVAQPAGCQAFPETGHTVCGAFLTYWRTHGGLAQQGYPISDEFQEISELDQKPYTVQYFERAVFERHPENAPPYDVLLAQLGTYQLRRKYPAGPPRPTPTVAGDAWAALRARPLRLPTVAPGGACPATPGRIVAPDFGAGLGDGPVYPVGLGTEGVLHYGSEGFPAPWGGQKVLWVSAPTYSGPALIRGHQIDGPNDLRFAEGADPPGELALDSATGGSTPAGWRNWPSYTRVRAPGCYAYQVDGTSFTRVIVFRAVPGQ